MKGYKMAKRCKIKHENTGLIDVGTVTYYPNGGYDIAEKSFPLDWEVIEEISEDKSEVEECEECGNPLDDSHQVRNAYCERCNKDLGFTTCAEDHSAFYCTEHE